MVENQSRSCVVTISEKVRQKQEVQEILSRLLSCSLLVYKAILYVDNQPHELLPGHLEAVASQNASQVYIELNTPFAFALTPAAGNKASVGVIRSEDALQPQAEASADELFRPSLENAFDKQTALILSCLRALKESE